MPEYRFKKGDKVVVKKGYEKFGYKKPLPRRSFLARLFCCKRIVFEVYSVEYHLPLNRIGGVYVTLRDGDYKYFEILEEYLEPEEP